MAPSTESDLIQAVGDWANRNFADRRAADLGIIEELGEATHCVLKRFQGIRGFKDDDFFVEHLTDALADMSIYLCDWCYMHNAFFKWGRNQNVIATLQPEDERKLIVHLLQAASSMLSLEEINKDEKISPMMEGTYNMIAQRVATGIELWAHMYNIDIRFAVAATWAKVSQRDWIAKPEGPAEVTGQHV